MLATDRLGLSFSPTYADRIAEVKHSNTLFAEKMCRGKILELVGRIMALIKMTVISQTVAY
jgi:hypothetical protein